ncbi:hypothetical protein Asp14428_68530 [Actinoplanes sp. NBRC 14428]|uniref:Two-component sensor histidine kinase n=1 Tax=Pseudosporangium ferrugineum TaxID=439699 RepID=A0A2T0RQB9_9ACTN|nr:hypothetical protein [Pseudosporangium ferrugineum]PRY23389.1 hypothetical protein CLV70_115122 [Pseudosporangium ferrugineum]BCJ55378.1 hypothetical protein Asp14428_68530 [Actinoplanes sp. NBRC 14428]
MRKALIVVAVVLAVVCGGLGLIVYRAVDLGRELVKTGVTQQQFDAQKVGAPEAAVRAALPEPLTDLSDEELYPGDPGRGGLPAGATCIYHTIKPFPADGAELWRFCFADGKLVKKSPLTIPE